MKLTKVWLVAILALVSVISAIPAVAKNKPHDGTPSQIVAHLTFDGKTPLDIALDTTPGGKRYLYVQNSEGRGVSVIDVSEPSRPKSLKTITWLGDAQLSRLDFLGDVALGDASEAASPVDARDFVVYDLSNPIEPRVAQRFTGVRRTIIDKDGFVYLLNGTGLWILSTAPVPEPDPSLYGG